MVNKLVMLVNFEDKRVVYVVTAENLHWKPSREDNKGDDSCEVVYVDCVPDFAPMVFTVFWSNYEQKYEHD